MIPDLVEISALKIAEALQRRYPNEVKNLEALYEWLAFKLSTVYVVAGCLLIGTITGKLLDTIVSVVSFALLRKLTGGYHFKSLTVCVIVSVLLLSTVPHIEFEVHANIILTALNVILISLNRSIEQGYKLFAIIVVFVGFYNDPACLAFFAQACTLLKGGEQHD